MCLLFRQDVFCPRADSSEDVVGEFCLVLFCWHFIECPDDCVNEYINHVSICPLSDGEEVGVFVVAFDVSSDDEGEVEVVWVDVLYWCGHV